LIRMWASKPTWDVVVILIQGYSDPVKLNGSAQHLDTTEANDDSSLRPVSHKVTHKGLQFGRN
jgi:hypothetical protein